MLTISDTIRRALDESGVSQAELARRIGKSEATVSRYLSGEVDPPSSVLKRVAMATGKPWVAPRPPVEPEGVLGLRVICDLPMYRQVRALARQAPVPVTALLYGNGDIVLRLGDPHGPRDPASAAAVAA